MPREPGWWYGPPAATTRLLTPAAALYGFATAARMARPPTYQSKLPVICVGNFTAGGSGKTPLTMALAHRLVARGERPVVLTRGYGGSTIGPHRVDPAVDGADIVGDEPLLLARAAPVVVARDRAAGARAIERDGDATVILMDDGLQNPGLAKTLTIAVVDGARGFGNGRVIPAGPLRAPLATQAGRVGAVVFNGPPSAGLAAQLERLAPAAVQIEASLEPVADAGWLRGTRVVAFAGIGNPMRFFGLLRDLGADVVVTVPRPDHARFTDREAAELIALGARLDAVLVTTAKDHVRLGGHTALASTTRVLDVEMVFSTTAAAALEMLLSAVIHHS